MADEQTTAEIRAELEKAFRAQLPAEVRDSFDEFISGLDEGIRELSEKLEATNEEDAGTIDELREALLHVKEWMHDVLYLGKPMRDPRAVLRIVERAIEP